ncbi:mutagen-sensitive 301 [Oratosquilla oratoria]|uniref:mutagen-sensitive 301 n=1 Tax=Oratosquilla oratoria TaxID=337810 RepID=UPI003F75A583
MTQRFENDPENRHRRGKHKLRLGQGQALKPSNTMSAEQEAEDGSTSPVLQSRRKNFGQSLRLSQAFCSLSTQSQQSHSQSSVSSQGNADISVMSTPVRHRRGKIRRVSQSPVTSFMNASDSFSRCLDFDEIDTLCSLPKSPWEDGTCKVRTSQNNVKTSTQKKKSNEVSDNVCPSYNAHNRKKVAHYEVDELDFSVDFNDKTINIPEKISDQAYVCRTSSSQFDELKSSGEFEPVCHYHKEKRCNCAKYLKESGSSILPDNVPGESVNRSQEIASTPCNSSPDMFSPKSSAKGEQSPDLFSPKSSLSGVSITSQRTISQRTTSQTSVLSTPGSQPLLGRLQQKLGKNEGVTPKELVFAKARERSKYIKSLLEEEFHNHNSNASFQLGPFYGLPSKVQDLLRSHRGITQLYKWQEECLRLEAVELHKNLLYCLPTSGGKTLVAEILLMREVLLHRKDAIFILPYIAIVQEKVRGLAPFAVEMNFLTEEYAGSKGTYPPPHRNRNIVYVATIEKAEGILNSLIQTGRLKELGLVVVDEAHMVGEKQRGGVLEATLTKLMYIQNNIQIVAMSATIGNIEELGRFLKAEIYKGNFRPIELKEYVKVESQLHEINPTALDEATLFSSRQQLLFPYSKQQKKIDIDMVGALVLEVVPQNSCLVFCPTKKNCENVSQVICRILPKALRRFKHKEKLALYKALVEEGNGAVCPILKKTLSYGIAYHHSGLTMDERHLLEKGFLDGVVCCLCCTSTLATGINLPARRVILRSPYIGIEFLSRTRYKQMAGRAGRAGLDTYGESILIAQPHEMNLVMNMLTSPMERCTSSLLLEEEQGFASLILSTVGLGLAKTHSDLMCLLEHTLLWQNTVIIREQMKEKVAEKVEQLCQLDLMFVQKTPSSQTDHGHSSTSSLDSSLGSPTASKELIISRLGRAVIQGNVDIRYAKVLYEELCSAQESVAVGNHLYLIYLVVPYNVTESIRPVASVLHSQYMKLNTEENEVARHLGITEVAVVNHLTGQKNKALREGVLARFYIALLLYNIWKEKDVWKASAEFQVHRGIVQQILTSSAAFAVSICHFCQELDELSAFCDVLPTFARQLSICATEIAALVDLSAVKKGCARQMYSCGYTSIADVAGADPEELAKQIDNLTVKEAEQIICSAKVLLQGRDSLDNISIGPQT